MTKWNNFALIIANCNCHFIPTLKTCWFLIHRYHGKNHTLTHELREVASQIRHDIRQHAPSMACYRFDSGIFSHGIQKWSNFRKAMLLFGRLSGNHYTFNQQYFYFTGQADLHNSWHMAATVWVWFWNFLWWAAKLIQN